MHPCFLVTLVAVLIFLITVMVYSQETEWMHFSCSSYITHVADDDDFLWLGGDGLVRFTKSDGEMTFYNKANSGLPENHISALASDGHGTVWVATETSLVQFDGENWTEYDTINSEFPDNNIQCLNVDHNGNIWIGTLNGLAKFDGQDWTVYTPSNSGLPHWKVNAMTSDHHGNVWVATYDNWIGDGRLSMFNGNSWTIYHVFKDKNIKKLETDLHGNLWIIIAAVFTDIHYLVKFSSSGLSYYNQTNSEIPSSTITTVSSDDEGNVWLGTSAGLAMFDGSAWTVHDSRSTVMHIIH